MGQSAVLGFSIIALTLAVIFLLGWLYDASDYFTAKAAIRHLHEGKPVREMAIRRYDDEVLPGMEPALIWSISFLTHDIVYYHRVTEDGDRIEWYDLHNGQTESLSLTHRFVNGMPTRWLPFGGWRTELLRELRTHLECEIRETCVVNARAA